MKAKRATPRLRDDRWVYRAALKQWADMYVSGAWSLEQFEAHADRMREALFGPRADRP